MDKSPGQWMDELITSESGSAWFGPFGAEWLRTGDGTGTMHPTRNIGLGWITYGFIRVIQPKIILEVGSAGSSIPMLHALRDNYRFGSQGCLHTIDSFPWGNDVEFEGRSYKEPHLAFLKLIDKLGFNGFCTFYHAKSQDVGKTWNQPIDMLVVDGDHTGPAVKADWDLFSKWLVPGGYAFFHDLVACPDDIGRMLEIECGPESDFSFALEPNSLSLSIIQKKFTVSPKAYFDCMWRTYWKDWEKDHKASLTDARGSGLVKPWNGKYIPSPEEWESARKIFQERIGIMEKNGLKRGEVEIGEYYVEGKD